MPAARNALILLSTALAALAGCIAEDDGAPQDAGGAVAQALENGTEVRVDELSMTGSFQASVEVPDPVNGGSGCGRLGEGTNLKTIPWTFMAASENGSLVKVTKVVLTLSLDSETNLDSDIFFYDPMGTMLGSATQFNVQTGSTTETISIEDRVFEAGEYKVEVRGCSGAEMEWTLKGEATYTVVGPAPVEP